MLVAEIWSTESFNDDNNDLGQKICCLSIAAAAGIRWTFRFEYYVERAFHFEYLCTAIAVFAEASYDAVVAAAAAVANINRINSQ